MLVLTRVPLARRGGSGEGGAARRLPLIAAKADILGLAAQQLGLELRTGR